MNTSSGHKSITRIDQPEKHNHCWQVRVQFKKQTYRKFFSDSVHGGYHTAKRKAVKWRDRIEREIGKRRTEKIVQANKPRPRSDTGRLGVYLSTQNTHRRGKLIRTPAYFARWSPFNSKPMARSFSIRKWGKRKALKMACKVRAEHES